MNCSFFSISAALSQPATTTLTVCTTLTASSPSPRSNSVVPNSVVILPCLYPPPSTPPCLYPPLPLPLPLPSTTALLRLWDRTRREEQLKQEDTSSFNTIHSQYRSTHSKVTAFLDAREREKRTTSSSRARRASDANKIPVLRRHLARHRQRHIEEASIIYDAKVRRRSDGRSGVMAGVV
jgi:hypothetical protein